MTKRAAVLGFLLLYLLPIVSEPLKVIAVEYPPFTMSTGGGTGLAFELFREALGSDYEVIPEFYPPARSALLFKDGQAPVTFFNSAINNIPGTVRIDYLRVRIEFYFNARRNILAWSNLEDLSGKRLGVLRLPENENPGGIYQQFEAAGLQIVKLESIEQAFQLLDLGRLDLVMSVDLTAAYSLSKLFPGQSHIRATNKPYLIYPGSVWINREAPQEFP